MLNVLHITENTPHFRRFKYSFNKKSLYLFLLYPLKNEKFSQNVIHWTITLITHLFGIVHFKTNYNYRLSNHCFISELILVIYALISNAVENKGDPNYLENYQPITILSCLGKLFTLILNNRLKDFTGKYDIIYSCQAGFRKNYCTADTIFIIKSLIERANKNKVYFRFVDFKQASDTVWRPGLWSKLHEHHINGKCLTIIQNLYKDIKSKIIANGISSAYFLCLNGVR